MFSKAKFCYALLYFKAIFIAILICVLYNKFMVLSEKCIL